TLVAVEVIGAEDGAFHDGLGPLARGQPVAEHLRGHRAGAEVTGPAHAGRSRPPQNLRSGFAPRAEPGHHDATAVGVRGGVVARLDVQRIGIRQVVHQHVMIADAAGVIFHDAVEDAGDVDDPDLDAALLEDLASDRLAGALTQLDEAAGQAPLSERRRLAAPDEQHVVRVEDDRADTDPWIVRILAAHAGPVSHASVAYFSRTRRSTAAVSSALRPSGRMSRPCSRSNAAASAWTTSSSFGRWPSAASSVVKVASGSWVVGKIAARRAAST